jgi:hypothetical protein
MANVADLIEQFVARLEEVVQAQARDRVFAALGAAAPGTPARRPRVAASPQRRLQGQYLGLLRGLTGRARQRVQAVARESGVASALRLGRRLRRS